MWEWRYLGRGSVVHGLRRRSAGIDHVALCGRSPSWFDPAGWLGTGSQSEYERAESLPKCRTCVKFGAR